MTPTYLEAHQRLNAFLEFFFVGCVGASLVGAIHYNWWFAAVWVGAGFFDGLIVISASQGAVTGTAPSSNEFASELGPSDDELARDEFADQRAFAGKFLKFTILLATTVLAAGFALRNPWWGNLLVAVVTWFVSMVGIPLLCAPRKNGESDIID
jgi:hypothetical protein